MSSFVNDNARLTGTAYWMPSLTPRESQFHANGQPKAVLTETGKPKKSRTGQTPVEKAGWHNAELHD